MLPLITHYLPEICEQIHRHITRVGFEPMTFAILEQCYTHCSGVAPEFESHSGIMPVIFFTELRYMYVSTKYTVLTHIGVYG